MTAEEVDNMTNEIVANLEMGADIAALFRPELVPFIVLGKALDKIVPGLATSITKWIEGNPPTPEEREDLRKKLAVLQDPDLP